MTNKTTIELTVNGKTHQLLVLPNWTLLDALREQLGLIGTKCGCNKGECGACTVLLNGKATLSCMTLAISVDKQEVTTIEGLAEIDELLPIQQAFIDQGAIQCGFCTPGMVMSAKALLDENPDPTEEEIKQGINGNICRCTGYIKIIDAIKSVAGNDS